MINDEIGTRSDLKERYASRHTRYTNDFGKRTIIAFVLLIMAALILFGLMYYNANTMNTEVIDRIFSMQLGKYEFTDMANELAVESIDDLCYSMTNTGNMTIYYGKMVIKIPKKHLKDEELAQKLARIGIKILSRDVIDKETGKQYTQYKVQSWGEDIRYVVTTS